MKVMSTGASGAMPTAAAAARNPALSAVVPGAAPMARQKGTRGGRAAAKPAAVGTSPGPAAPTRPVPPRRVVASHEAHYWFTAGRLLDSFDPEARPPRGARQKRQFDALLHGALLPIHPEAAAASRTSVGQLEFAHAVQILAEIRGVEDVPETSLSAIVSIRAKRRLEDDGVGERALHAFLTATARAGLERAGYVWRWER